MLVVVRPNRQLKNDLEQLEGGAPESSRTHGDLQNVVCSAFCEVD